VRVRARPRGGVPRAPPLGPPFYGTGITARRRAPCGVSPHPGGSPGRVYRRKCQGGGRWSRRLGYSGRRIAHARAPPGSPPRRPARAETSNHAIFTGSCRYRFSTFDGARPAGSGASSRGPACAHRRPSPCARVLEAGPDAPEGGHPDRSPGVFRSRAPRVRASDAVRRTCRAACGDQAGHRAPGGQQGVTLTVRARCIPGNGEPRAGRHRGAMPEDPGETRPPAGRAVRRGTVRGSGPPGERGDCAPDYFPVSCPAAAEALPSRAGYMAPTRGVNAPPDPPPLGC